MKLSAMAVEIKSKFDKKEINKEDLYELYRDKYIEYAELKQIEIRR